jgi:hypothetical protein
MKRFILSILLVLAPISAALAAVNADPDSLPPVKYDYPYRGKLTVKYGTMSQLWSWCGGPRVPFYACAHSRGPSCSIYIVHVGTKVGRGNNYRITDHAWTRSTLRHEIAHCNGWPGNHPGERLVRRNPL